MKLFTVRRSLVIFHAIRKGLLWHAQAETGPYTNAERRSMYHRALLQHAYPLDIPDLAP